MTKGVGEEKGGVEKGEVEVTRDEKKEVIEEKKEVVVIPTVISSEKKLRVLIIGAHIGDAEITGGLLATKYAAEGHYVAILHMTAGEKGNPNVDVDLYRQQRISEAKASAKTFGAKECIVLNHPDAELQNTLELHHELCDILRQIRPDIVLTHWRGSFHRDHCNTYRITMEAALLAALPGIRRMDHAGTPLPAHVVKGLYYLENWEDLEEYEPNLWVPITEEIFKRWVEGCLHHALLRGEVSFGYLNYYSGLAAKRGAEVGVKYAVTVSLPPISRKRKVEMLPVEQEPVLIF